MKIAIFSPYGSSSQETGILGLLGNYVKSMFEQVWLLRCNGVFSLCERDAESGWRRGIQNCFRCMGEQARLAIWSGLPCEDLSAYVHPEDVLDSKRWVTTLPIDELEEANFAGIRIFDLCRGAFRSRFGSEQPDLRNPVQDETARRLMISSIRMCLATDRFHKEQHPDLVLVSGESDYITSSFIARSRARSRDIAIFRWDLTNRSIKITHPRTLQEFSCPLVFEDITGMRGDSRTWPWELVKIVEDILVFLELSSSQLSLPMAR